MDICWSAVNLESCSGGCNWCPQRRFWRRGAFGRCWYKQQALLLLVKPSMAAPGGRGSGGKGKHWGWQRNSVERQHGNTLLGKVAPSKAVVLSNTFILEWQHEWAGFLSSHAYEQPLLSWAFLSGVLCGAGKSVIISFPFGDVSSPSHILIVGSWNVSLKKVLLWINRCICGEKENCLHLPCTARLTPGHAEFLCLEYRLRPAGTLIIISASALLPPHKILMFLFCFREISLISKFC